MDRNAFDEMKLTQDSHWWFKGKKTILEKLLISLCLPSNAKILEIGCGTGSNLALLSKFGTLTALEIDGDARKYATQLSGLTVLDGWLPDGLFNILNKSYDLICMFDVLEHIKNDDDALIALRNHLISDRDREGKLFVTVPAYQWMYSKHDKKLSHFRRYSRSDIDIKLQHAGYKILKSGYMNSLLFPLMLAGRLMDKISRDKDRGAKVPPAIINKFLFNVFSAEKNWISKITIPFGGSVFAISQVDKDG